jgi:hypothetical protein
MVFPLGNSNDVSIFLLLTGFGNQSRPALSETYNFPGLPTSVSARLGMAALVRRKDTRAWARHCAP